MDSAFNLPLRLVPTGALKVSIESGAKQSHAVRFILGEWNRSSR